MEDHTIVQLYWDRDPEAIPATTVKYSSYCSTIASNILWSREDADECVNDTWLGAWNAMPPHRPVKLAPFLGRITRNLAINKLKHNTAQKRSSNVSRILSELEECTAPDPQSILENKELAAALNGFLARLPEKKRSLFLCRYWYADSIAILARRFHMSEGAVTMQLKRLRQQLRSYLAERGICV